MHAECAWLRVWAGYGRQAGRDFEDAPDPGPRWLLVEWRTDGTLKYALSNLPAGTSIEQAVALWKSRWQVGQGYQQLKDELGLDHFEGRSWSGFHHHATLTFLAYGFLALERARGTPTTLDPEEPPPSPPTPAPAVRLGRSGRLSLPAIRRALQPYRLPPCRLPCPRCHAWLSGFT